MQCPNIVGPPPNWSVPYLDYRASINSFKGWWVNVIEVSLTTKPLQNFEINIMF